MIIYINNGLAYVPTCSDVEKIFVVTTSEHNSFSKGYRNSCTNGYKIKYQKKGSDVIMIGYLQNQNIISQNLKKIDCISASDHELIINNKIKLKKTPNGVEISNYTSSIVKLHLKHNSLKRLFNHHAYLVNGSDLIEEIDNLLNINNGGDSIINNNNQETPNDIRVINDNSVNGSYFNIMINGFVEFFSPIFDFGFRFFWILLFVIFVYFLIIIILKFVRMCPLYKAKANSIALQGNEANNDFL